MEGENVQRGSEFGQQYNRLTWRARLRRGNSRRKVDEGEDK